MLAGTGLVYKFVDGVVIIVEEEKRPIQTKTVTGTVVDSKTKEPLLGVNVMVKNSRLGTVTDFDGNFSIKIPQNDAVLVFSYIGYVNHEVKITESTHLQVKMEAETLGLEEVVVTGYQTIDKRELTSSIASVTAEDLDIVGALSIDKMLEGKATGLMVTSLSSTPDAASKIGCEEEVPLQVTKVHFG